VSRHLSLGKRTGQIADEMDVQLDTVWDHLSMANS
jgi:DNA-binding CsgD family transcriptional regulator